MNKTELDLALLIMKEARELAAVQYPDPNRHDQTACVLTVLVQHVARLEAKAARAWP